MRLLSATEETAEARVEWCWPRHVALTCTDMASVEQCATEESVAALCVVTVMGGCVDEIDIEVGFGHKMDAPASCARELPIIFPSFFLRHDTR